MDFNSLLAALRMTNAFGQPQLTQPPAQPAQQPIKLPTAQDSAQLSAQPAQPGAEQPDTENPYDLYKPQTKLTNQYSQGIQQMPQREQYPPGVLRRIAASLVGASGDINASDRVMDKPYDEAMNSWKTRQEALRYGMSNEASANTLNERMVQNIVMEQRKRAELKARVDKAQAALKGGAKIVGADDYGNTVIAHNDGAQETLYGVTPTQLTTTAMTTTSAEKRGAAANTSAEKRASIFAGASMANNQATNQTRANISANEIAARQGLRDEMENGLMNRLMTRFFVDPNTGPESLRAADANAQQFMGQHPDAKEFFKQNPKTGLWSLDPTKSSSWFGLVDNSEEYKKVAAELDAMQAAAPRIKPPLTGAAPAGSGKPITPPKSNLGVMEASKVPPEQRIVGKEYLMGDGKTSRIWTGNPTAPWKKKGVE
jgi:hypothetical protein